jgi:hypothetical protein
MSKPEPHNKLIEAAAKAALAPLGCIRRGQSRTWHFDQGLWAVLVSFQPSGWLKGSYLNTGVRLFWHPGPGYCFNNRPVDFVPFESVEQFTPLIEQIAAVAAREVLALRHRFKTLSDIQYNLLFPRLRDGWLVYDAAVVSWLLGDIELSKMLFRRIAEWPTHGANWQLILKERSSALAVHLDDPPNFLANVVETIQYKRKLIGLTPIPDCLERLVRARVER